MAEQYRVSIRGVALPSRRRSFIAFCAAMAALIGVLVALSPLSGPAASTTSAGRTDRTSHRGGDGGGAVGGRDATVGEVALPPPAEATATLQRLIDAGEPVYCGAGTKLLVALTFDDGPGPYTQETLDLLRANGLTATFFTVGKLYADPRFRGLLREEARLGAVGDHTWDHVSITGMSGEQLDGQIARTRVSAAADSGKPVFLFRPPLGQHDRAVDEYLRSAGMLDVLWSVDSEDSQGASASKIFRNVRDHLSPGDIVLLHENRGTTQRALPRIIELIERLGYRTVTVPQLLAADPPSTHQLRTHTCA